MFIADLAGSSPSPIVGGFIIGLASNCVGLGQGGCKLPLLEACVIFCHKSLSFWFSHISSWMAGSVAWTRGALRSSSSGGLGSGSLATSG